MCQTIRSKLVILAFKFGEKRVSFATRLFNLNITQRDVKIKPSATM